MHEPAQTQVARGALARSHAMKDFPMDRVPETWAARGSWVFPWEKISPDQFLGRVLDGWVWKTPDGEVDLATCRAVNARIKEHFKQHPEAIKILGEAKVDSLEKLEALLSQG